MIFDKILILFIIESVINKTKIKRNREITSLSFDTQRIDYLQATNNSF